MPTTHYSFKLKRKVPLLSDEEYRPIEEALRFRIQRIKDYRRSQSHASLADAKRHSCDDALRYYESLSGIRLDDPDQLYWVQLSRHGRPCPKCQKLLRTPRAKLCVECGFELPEGEVAGPAMLRD